MLIMPPMLPIIPPMPKPPHPSMPMPPNRTTSSTTMRIMATSVPMFCILFTSLCLNVPLTM
ncbi:MAG: hypothetical protein C4309_06560 [Chloroflexota bacterium]